MGIDAKDGKRLLRDALTSLVDTSNDDVLLKSINLDLLMHTRSGTAEFARRSKIYGSTMRRRQSSWLTRGLTGFVTYLTRRANEKTPPSGRRACVVPVPNGNVTSIVSLVAWIPIISGPTQSRTSLGPSQAFGRVFTSYVPLDPMGPFGIDRRCTRFPIQINILQLPNQSIFLPNT